MKQRGKSCYQFSFPTGDGNPSAPETSSMDSPFTSSEWGSLSSSAAVSSTLTSSTSTLSPTELIVTSQNLPQTSSSIPLSHSSTSSTLNNIPMKGSSLPTEAPSSDEDHSMLSSVLPSLTQYTSEAAVEGTYTVAKVQEATTLALAPSSVKTSTEDQNKSSDSLLQIQTAKPQISTTDSYSLIPLLSQFSTPFSEASYESPASVVTTSQQPQTFMPQEDTSETAPSDQSTIVTTLGDKSYSVVSDSSTDVTSPLPMASTGKSEQTTYQNTHTLYQYRVDIIFIFPSPL
jgi:hypothetical protein